MKLVPSPGDLADAKTDAFMHEALLLSPRGGVVRCIFDTHAARHPGRASGGGGSHAHRTADLEPSTIGSPGVPGGR